MPIGKPFERGKSPNPGGRTKEQRDREKRLADAILGLAGDDCMVYVERLHQIALGTAGAEDKDSIKAIEVLLVRAVGKPKETLEVVNDSELTTEQEAEEKRIIALEEIAAMSKEERERLLAMGEHAAETTH